MILAPLVALQLASTPAALPVRHLPALVCRAADGGGEADAGADAGADVDAGMEITDAGPPPPPFDAGFVFDAGDAQAGGPMGDNDMEPNAVPATCNTDEDCPAYYNCVAHACHPQSVNQRKVNNGCSTGDAGASAGLAALFALGLLRRRR